MGLGLDVKEQRLIDPFDLGHPIALQAENLIQLWMGHVVFSRRKVW